MKFDDQYTDYWKNRVSNPEIALRPPDENAASHFLGLLMLNRSDVVLDVGCSFGRFHHLLKREATCVYGIDIEQEAINQCKQLGYSRLEVCGMEQTPFPDSSIDKVFCWAVFDCVNQETAILEMNRILKTGGRLLLTGKNSDYLATDHEAFVAERNARLKAFPNHFTDVRSLHEVASLLGFEVEKTFCFEKRGDFASRKILEQDPALTKPFYEYLMIVRKIGDARNEANFTISDSYSNTAKKKAAIEGSENPLEHFRKDYKRESRISSRSKPIVHIVHHVDTEGPLCEPLDELFLRIEATLGTNLDLEPTASNLKLLQSEDYRLADEEMTRALKQIVRPELLEFKNNWDEVEEMLDRILTPTFRNKYKDSFANGWIYNWHIIDHVGFEHNQRSKAIGYQKVFDFYLKKLMATGSTADSVQWHFHPVPFDKEVHHCATSYLNSYHEFSQIIARRLIDKNWFPVVNRAGFHTVRPDSNWLLEQWMPFDASNQSIDNEDSAFADSVNGRFGDWRGAPSDWSIYNPDLNDWRKKGCLKRSIARCLNMNTRFRNITIDEFKKAFARAQKNHEDVYVGITNHDFREMSSEIDAVYNMLKAASKDYPGVSFKFSDAVSAFRECLNYGDLEITANTIRLEMDLQENLLIVRATNGKPFGSQPFLALKTRQGAYHTDNFDFGPMDSMEYFYTFDASSLQIGNLSSIAVAANDIYGNTSIVRIDL